MIHYARRFRMALVLRTALLLIAGAFAAAGSLQAAPGGFSLSNDAPVCDTAAPVGPAVQLHWSSSSGATSYDVYRNGSQISSGITGTAFYNSAGLTAGQSYSYFIRARNSSGSTDSNTISVSIPSGICGGGAPGGFSLSNDAPVCDTAAPVGPAVQLHWNSSSGATSYDVYRNGSQISSGITGTAFYNSAGLTAGQSYSYFIRARNSSGSTDSNTISVSIPSGICGGGAPGGFSLSNDAPVCDTAAPVGPAVQLHWNSSSGATSYDVYRNGSQISSGVTGTAFYNSAGLTAGQSYSYFIRARNSSGSTDSNTISVSIPSGICGGGSPGGFSLSNDAPVCDTAAPVGPAVQLHWNSSSGATSYDVYRNGSQISSGITGTAFYNSAGLTAGQSYSYFIRARNSSGSTDSNTISVSIPSGICGGGSPGGFSLSNDAPVCDTAAPVGPAVQLHWNSSSGATSYDVYRNGSQISSGITGTAFYNSAGLTAGQSYSYFIRARNSSGSTDSNTINVSIPSGICGGGAPGGFSLSNDAPVCDTAVPVGPAVQLHWNSSSGATSYDVYRNGSQISSGVTGTAFYNSAGLTAGQSYSYFIRARNSSGSIDSNTINVSIPPGICGGGAPGGFSLSNDAPVCDTAAPVGPAVQLHWNSSSGATSYDVYRNGSQISSGVTGTAFYNSAGLTAGQSYSYFIRARNSSGSIDSNTINVSIPPGICGGGAPGGFSLSNDAPVCDTAAPVGPAVQLHWNSSSGATSYDVYRNGSQISSGVTGTAFYNNAGLTAGQSYNYFIRARNSSGSIESNTINVSIPSGICGGGAPGGFSLSNDAPVCDTAAPVGPAVQLHWNSSSGATSYDVYRNGSQISSGVTGTAFYNNAGLTAGQRQFNSIRARNSSGSTDSNTISVSIPSGICGGGTPGGFSLSNDAPVCDTAAPVGPAVQLHWNSSSGATSYATGPKRQPD